MTTDGEGLGIVVLTHGGGEQQAPLIESLLAEGIPADAIVVVHNPVEPGEPAPSTASGCRVVQAERNVGYAAGMNLGIAMQTGRGFELLLLLTHDARFRGGALGELLSAARRRPGYGVLGPALVLAGTDEPYSFGGRTAPNGIGSHILELPAELDDGVLPCDWVDGGTILVRTEAIERVGTFDERFWGYCEESDLCLRARRAGFEVGAVVAAVADQEPGGLGRPGVWSYLMTRNGAEYARRFAGPRGAPAVEARALRVVAFNLLRVPLRLVRRRPGGVGEPWALAVGTARGAIDFLRGRWGPPPRGLPGMGDVRNV